MRAMILVTVAVAVLIPVEGAFSCDLERLYREAEPVLDASGVSNLAPPDAAGLGWGTSYTLWSYITFYEATGDPRVLDRFILIADRVWSVRDDRLGRTDEIRGEILPTWSSLRYAGGRRAVQMVLTAVITFPMARFSRLVLEDPALADYHAKAWEYLLLTEEAVAVHDREWRDGPHADEGAYYESPTMMTSCNRMHAMGRTLLELWKATGDERYHDRAERLAVYFRRRLVVTPDGAIDWGHFMPDPLGRPPTDEDLSHGALSVDFAALCAEHGMVFTPEDMLGFVRTLSTRVYRGDGKFASTAAGNVWEGSNQGGIGNVMCWGRILRYDPSPIEFLRPLVCNHMDKARRPWLGAPFILLAERHPYQPPATRQAER